MRGLLILSLLFVAMNAVAQEPHDDYYYPYAEPEKRVEDPFSDSKLFYRANLFTDDLYGHVTDFRLPITQRRGENYQQEALTLFGLPVSYRQQTLLRALGGEEYRTIGLQASCYELGTTGGQRNYHFVKEIPLDPYRVSARYAMQNYRFGLSASMNRMVGQWQLRAAIDGRTGRDAVVDGVFTNSLQVGLCLTREWHNERRLHLVLTLPFSERGNRSPSTDEAFTLLNNPHYNPSWGFQDGKVRNARVQRTLMPLVALNWSMPLKSRTTMEVSLQAEMGRVGRSALNWYDARSPFPDNYRYMPSFLGDQATNEAWRLNDTRYTQLNWDEMIALNRLGDGHAIYALEERVERATRLAARVAFSSEVDDVTLHYGAKITYDNSRYFKQMDDLLGATHIIDIDQFLLDDDTYCNYLENNLQSPSRRITEGDRFGYDYALSHLSCWGWLGAVWQYDRFVAELWGALGDERISRKGYYEKELFPGDGSLGRSPQIDFTPYTFKARFGYRFLPHQTLVLALAAGAVAPSENQLFVQPLYNNRPVEGLEEASYYGAQLSFNNRHAKVDWNLTAYATHHRNHTESRSYFDDLSGCYANMSVTGLTWRAMGLEAAVEWRLHRRWQLAAAVSVGDVRYTEDCRVTVLSDTDNSYIDRDAVAHLDGCRPGGVPQLSAVASVRYFGPKGWGATLSGGYVGGRYVDPTALRRTERVASQNGSAYEFFEAFTRQERLDDLLTIDLSLFKRIYFNHEHSMLVSLHLGNLTGEEYQLYGYESPRSQRVGADTGALRLPQANRYLYGYPRRVMVVASFRF